MLKRHEKYVKVRFPFDVDRQGRRDRFAQYGINEKDSGSKDKKALMKAYNLTDANLDVFKNTEEEKFIIPYEMADLYCLMMGVMKESPTFYSNKELQLQDMQSIVEYNKKLVDILESENLPAQISDYIKQTPEYYNAVYIINYAPYVIERISALLHLTPMSST